MKTRIATLAILLGLFISTTAFANQPVPASKAVASSVADYIEEEMEYFISINPQNGEVIKIQSLANVHLIQMDYSALDHLNDRYYFMGIDDNNNARLYTIDINTGAIIFDPLSTPFSFCISNFSVLYFLTISSLQTVSSSTNSLQTSSYPLYLTK